MITELTRPGVSASAEFSELLCFTPNRPKLAVPLQLKHRRLRLVTVQIHTIGKASIHGGTEIQRLEAPRQTRRGRRRSGKTPPSCLGTQCCAERAGATDTRCVSIGEPAVCRR